ncbi:PaaI family thioesterase [Haladaptatus sp. DFWS20]|uniref:PaaI family thioesterase n=1 Tax=Haladaptatus sp. DFWS20 TaxID=3403467 RepID=UPI003EBC5612
MTDESDRDQQKGFDLSADDPLGQLRKLAEGHSFIDELSPQFRSFEDGTLYMLFPHQEQWVNPGMEGSLHGGIVCAMLDTVMGFALMGTAATTEVNSGPTVNLNVNFLVGADEDFEAVGDVVRMGSSTAVVDGILRGVESGETIATA